MKDSDINKNLFPSFPTKLRTIIDKISFDKTYEEGKNAILEYFKLNIFNEKVINTSMKNINNIIILKGVSQYKILSVIPLICQMNPASFISHVDIIISIFQNCLNREDNSPFFSQISQYFGDTVQILLNKLNCSENKYNQNNNIFLAYTKFKYFCLSNMKSDNINCQICGTLCLTAFIENCSFNYLKEENLKFIFDILCELINKDKFPAKLEILNCFISLIFCSEEKYSPYAKETLYIILKFVNNKEWLIRKFALNIIYTMLFYFKKEIMEKKEYIIEYFKLLKKENNSEVKDMIDQIYIILYEDKNNNFNIMNKNVYSSDSLFKDSKNSKSQNESKNKNEFFCSKNKSNGGFESNTEENEDINEKNIKTSREPERIIKTFKNNFIKNNIEKKIVKSKSNNKRNVIKSNDINNIIKINKSSKRKCFSNNIKLIDEKNKINEIIQKIKKNKSVEKSRNSSDRYFSRNKQKPMSIVLKRYENFSKEIKKSEHKDIKNMFNSSKKNKKIISIKNKAINNNKKNPINQIHVIKKNSELKKSNIIQRKNENKLKRYIDSSINMNNNKILKIQNNIIKNKRNNNSFELNIKRNLGEHKLPNNKINTKFIKNKKVSDIHAKDKRYKNFENKIKDNNHKYTQFENKYIKNIKPDYSGFNNHSEKQRLLNNNNIITSSNNNNITINNNVISITDEISSRKETSIIENKFNEYKNETSKIINQLKSQINSLKSTLYNFEEIENNKKKLIHSVKDKNFEQAFEIAVKIGNIQEIYYVIKNCLLNKDEINIPKNILANIMGILCKDILLCENLRLICVFIIKNIVEKNIILDKELNKEIHDSFLEIYNTRKELCLFKKDINNLLKIVDYFKEDI